MSLNVSSSAAPSARLGRAFFVGLGLILGMLLGFFTLALLSAGAIYDYEDTVTLSDPLPDVDVVVCLAGAKGRLAAAGGLWNRYVQEKEKRHSISKIPVLYFSGMGRHSDWTVLSKQIRPEILQRMKTGEVILENESGNTEENMQWLAHHVQTRGWTRILLVTSSYHMRRARLILERIFKKKFPQQDFQVETFSVHQDHFSAEKWRHSFYSAEVTVIEYIKWVSYRTLWEP